MRDEPERPTLVVVGGHSHSIGKTCVMAGLIAAFRLREWTAAKISICKPGECPANGPNCHCMDTEHPYFISEERSRLGNTDTARFLAAGASRAYWVRVKPQGLTAAVPELRQILEDSPFSMVESNSILHHVKPALYIVVLRPDIADWKQSAREFLHKADLGVVAGERGPKWLWEGIPEEHLDRIPLVEVKPPSYVSSELIEQVRNRLGWTG